METIRQLVDAQDAPVTATGIAADLETLGLVPGSTVLVHSSLKSLGWVCGGAQAVVEALEAAVRSYGTLVMPTQTTHLSDPETWTSPAVPESWWEEIRATMPAYDPDWTPSVGMGAIPEAFRTQPATVRSRHPHFSFAAWGEAAIDLTTDHDIDYGLGEGSPLARLYQRDALVLLMGVGFNRNTSFHLAEYRAEYRRKETMTRHAPVMIDGHRRWKPFEDVAIDSSDFEELGHDFFKHRRSCILEGKVGKAHCYLFPQRPCVDYAVSWFHRKRS
ncbi:MAG: aminoglycoside N(3)-acetyltransferase [Spirochaetota bacterium]